MEIKQNKSPLFVFTLHSQILRPTAHPASPSLSPQRPHPPSQESAIIAGEAEIMDSEETSFTILMFPWLAHGHIFPFLELAKKILKRKKFHISLCTTAINFSSIITFIHSNSLQDSIQVSELHLEPTPHLPPHFHTTKNLPSNLIFDLFKAFQTAKSSFSDTLTNLQPDLIIYDVFQPWVVELASSLGIPAVQFVIVGAATRSFVHHHYVCRNDDAFPFPELFLDEKEKRGLDNLMGFLSANVFDSDMGVFFEDLRFSAGFFLMKTCRGLEDKYVDYLSSVCKKRILGVGPLVADDQDRAAESNSEILEWLNENPDNSTVYICFGSECFLSEHETAEIAKALELCEAVKFIWVIRFPATEDRKSAEEVLPEGFLERMGERGRVVTGWAPQAKILGHPGTGAFVSHCGWSSLNESIYYGVPVVGMPMKVNMFVDVRMLVEAGACVEVGRDGDGVFKGEEIAKAINEVVVEESGEGLRSRARELSEKMRMEEEGAIDEAAEQLWQLTKQSIVSASSKQTVERRRR